MEIQAQASKTEVKPTPQTSTPANALPVRVTDATRVPMSLPTRKLAVPEMPGFYLYWHAGKNVAAALRAGYTFVDEGELELEQKNVATAADVSGSTDMGTRISIAAGNTVSDTNPEPERLYLMKLQNDWRQQDMALQAKQNESIAQAIRAGSLGSEDDPDRNKRYMKAGQDLFYPKAAKR